jgi:hypothetical protein
LAVNIVGDDHGTWPSQRRGALLDVDGGEDEGGDLVFGLIQ